MRLRRKRQSIFIRFCSLCFDFIFVVCGKRPIFVIYRRWEVSGMLQVRQVILSALSLYFLKRYIKIEAWSDI